LIYKFLMRSPIRRVVIVRGDKPTGVISRGTLLGYFRDRANELQWREDRLCEQIAEDVASLGTSVSSQAADLTVLVPGQI
jgi:hypothetical protein